LQLSAPRQYPSFLSRRSLTARLFQAQNSPARRAAPGVPLLDAILLVPAEDSSCRKVVLILGPGGRKRKKTVTKINSY
jgi:hypothetical protein